MLSYEQIGAAAMMSRACAGLARGRIVVALPGSEAAVRLAMDKLVIPELGHLVQQAQVPVVRVTSDDRVRPFKSTISDRRRRAQLLRVPACGRSREREAACAVGAAAGRVAAADLASTIFVPPFSRSAMDGYAVVADDTAWRDARAAGPPAHRRSRVHRRRPVARSSPRGSAQRSPPARRCQTAPTRW